MIYQGTVCVGGIKLSLCLINTPVGGGGGEGGRGRDLMVHLIMSRWKKIENCMWVSAIFELSGSIWVKNLSARVVRSLEASQSCI